MFIIHLYDQCEVINMDYAPINYFSEFYLCFYRFLFMCRVCFLFMHQHYRCSWSTKATMHPFPKIHVTDVLIPLVTYYSVQLLWFCATRPLAWSFNLLWNLLNLHFYESISFKGFSRSYWCTKLQCVPGFEILLFSLNSSLGTKRGLWKWFSASESYLKRAFKSGTFLCGHLICLLIFWDC